MKGHRKKMLSRKSVKHPAPRRLPTMTPGGNLPPGVYQFSFGETVVRGDSDGVSGVEEEHRGMQEEGAVQDANEGEAISNEEELQPAQGDAKGEEQNAEEEKSNVNFCSSREVVNEILKYNHDLNTVQILHIST